MLHTSEESWLPLRFSLPPSEVICAVVLKDTMKMHPGILRCARYSFAPNSLKYCGPERQSQMRAYVQAKTSDRGLGEMLEQFDTLYKYLAMIAYENNIRDPFDARVVEAYWLGNGLLAKTKYKPLATVLTDELELPKKLTPRQMATTLSKLDQAVAHHTFHVLNIFRRTGHLPIAHTLLTMDSCRISWGRIQNKTSNIKDQKYNSKIKNYLVEVVPLVSQDYRLILGKREIRKVVSIGLEPKIGEWVSVHWGYVCEVLSARQLGNLEYYTKLAIELANRP